MGLNPKQRRGMKVLIDRGRLPELLEGLSDSSAEMPFPGSTESSGGESTPYALLMEYRAMYPGFSDEELERLMQET